MKVLGELTAFAESYNRELCINTETVGVLDFLLAKAKYAMTLTLSLSSLTSTGSLTYEEHVTH